MTKKRQYTPYCDMIPFSKPQAPFRLACPRNRKSKAFFSASGPKHFLKSIVSNSCYIQYKFCSCKWNTLAARSRPLLGSKSIAQLSAPQCPPLMNSLSSADGYCRDVAECLWLSIPSSDMCICTFGALCVEWGRLTA